MADLGLCEAMKQSDLYSLKADNLQEQDIFCSEERNDHDPNYKEERFRVDRKKLEQMLQLDNNCSSHSVADDRLGHFRNGEASHGESCTDNDAIVSEEAERFFRKVMNETNTHITWPSKLKIGAKSKKDPHIKVCGDKEAVAAAKEKILCVLDTKSNKVTLKMDVSHTDHSHVIGKGGNNIKCVMQETGCHIHFPDSNRSTTQNQDKSNQVSIAGQAEGVEQARVRIRELLPLTFYFDLSGSISPDSVKPLIEKIQKTYSVTITFKQSRLYTTTCIVKGCVNNVASVKEATALLVDSLTGNRGVSLPIHTQLEIAPQHHQFMMGRSGTHITRIMHVTGAQILFPGYQVPGLPGTPGGGGVPTGAPGRGTVVIIGGIDSVYMAREQLIECLPLVLMFDIKDDIDVRQEKVNQLKDQLDVFISIKPKIKQPNKSVIVKSIERNARNMYLARQILLTPGDADASMSLQSQLPQSLVSPHSLHTQHATTAATLDNPHTAATAAATAHNTLGHVGLLSANLLNMSPNSMLLLNQLDRQATGLLHASASTTQQQQQQQHKPQQQASPVTSSTTVGDTTNSNAIASVMMLPNNGATLSMYHQHMQHAQHSPVLSPRSATAHPQHHTPNTAHTPSHTHNLPQHTRTPTHAGGTSGGGGSVMSGDSVGAGGGAAALPPTDDILSHNSPSHQSKHLYMNNVGSLSDDIHSNSSLRGSRTSSLSSSPHDLMLHPHSAAGAAAAGAGIAGQPQHQHSTSLAGITAASDLDTTLSDTITRDIFGVNDSVFSSSSQTSHHTHKLHSSSTSDLYARAGPLTNPALASSITGGTLSSSTSSLPSRHSSLSGSSQRLEDAFMHTHIHDDSLFSVAQPSMLSTLTANINNLQELLGDDYEKKKLMATKAIQKKPMSEQSRIPTDIWAGYGFSKSMPGSQLRDRLQQNPYTGPHMSTTYETFGSEEAEVDHSPWNNSPTHSSSHSSSLSNHSATAAVMPGGSMTGMGGSGLNIDQLARQLSPTTSPPRTPTQSHRHHHQHPQHQQQHEPSSSSSLTPHTELAELFSKMGLSKYIDYFQEQEIDVTTFLTLTEKDLKELGIPTFGARRKIALTIADLQKQYKPGIHSNGCIRSPTMSTQGSNHSGSVGVHTHSSALDGGMGGYGESSQAGSTTSNSATPTSATLASHGGNAGLGWAHLAPGANNPFLNTRQTHTRSPRSPSQSGIF